MKTGTRMLAGLVGALLLLTLGAFPARAEEETQVTEENHTTEDTPVTEAETIPVRFTDVSDEDWYAQGVYFCFDKGLMNGTGGGEFDPQGTINRAMMATVLHRLAGLPDVGGENPFTDVSEGTWYTGGVLWAAGQGAVLGFGDGTFGPAQHLTREQLAVILWRYHGSPSPKQTALEYADWASVSHWAEEGLAWALEKELLFSREEGCVSSGEPAMRCELAWAMMAYDRLCADEKPEEKPEPENLWTEFEQVMGYRPEAGTVLPSPYAPELFALNEAGYMTYLGERDTCLGVDVSAYQGEIDWDQVAAAGMEFAIIRVGYRGYTMGTVNPDARFAENMEGALAAGLDVGVYFFSQAVTVEEALEEAAFVLEAIRDYNLTYPVVFDWERQESRTSRTRKTKTDTVLACAVAFCDTVEAAGYIPMFYGSPSKAESMRLKYLADYPFWLAHYTKNNAATSYANHFDIWQYTEKGTVPGIKGKVDIDLAMRRF